MKDTLFYHKKTFNIRGKLYRFDEPWIMGIINVTPDSFYKGSRALTITDVMIAAENMISEGVTIIDIGGYSSRPGAEEISMEEELKRIISPIKEISKRFPEVIISIDSFRSEVVKEAVYAGASIVNDISGGKLDDNMMDTVAALRVPYVLMHMRGTPLTMKSMTDYENLIKELNLYFSEGINNLLSKGVNDIILDPGIGFAKTINQNFEILKNLSNFSNLGFPLMVGVSRKSIVYKTLNIEPEDGLNGSTVLNTLSLLNHASILRVHDIKATREVIKLMKNYSA